MSMSGLRMSRFGLSGLRGGLPGPARRPGRRAGRLGLRARSGALAGVLAASGVGASAAPASAHTAPPPTVPYTAAIDGYSAYQAESGCSNGFAQPGTVFLRDKIIRGHYGWQDIGLIRSCSSRYSGHEEGRALDWMIPVTNEHERQHAQTFLAWLLKTDAHGNPSANARRLGIMYMMYENKMWRSYQPADGWQPQYLSGQNCADLGAAYVTSCHRDHIHISMSWEGAKKRTSYWNPTAVPPKITSPGWGQDVTKGSTLTLRGQATPGSTLTLYTKVGGTSTYTKLASVTTDGFGRWRHPVTVDTTRYYYFTVAGGGTSNWTRVDAV